MEYAVIESLKTGALGGANTLTGLNFESKVDFQKLLEKVPGYSIDKMPDKAGMGAFFEGKLVARCFKKHAFYKFLTEFGVDWHKMLSKKPLPVDALLVIARETLFIIEVKYQQVGIWKLQTCDFKRKQYLKL